MRAQLQQALEDVGGLQFFPVAVDPREARALRSDGGSLVEVKLFAQEEGSSMAATTPAGAKPTDMLVLTQVSCMASDTVHFESLWRFKLL